MSVRLDVLRFLVHLALAAGLLVLLSPWLLYQTTLWNLGPPPTKPAQLASAERQAEVWKLAKGQGALHGEPMNPYGLVWRFFVGDPTPTPGETLAYWVASEHILRGARRSALSWHLSNAALTIWLTRHWTAEELATAAQPVFDNEMKYRARRAAEKAADGQPPERSRAASAM